MGRGAFDRRAQVRAALGDIDALRAVFEGPDGEALRRASDLEGPVLEAVLRERAAAEASAPAWAFAASLNLP